LRNEWHETPHEQCQTKTRKKSEDGYVLIAVIFMLALFVIALAVAAPRVAKSIQREREIETMHRGKQYIRAIKLYYRKFGRYPPNVDALVNTNEIRFLRKKYIDPTTGKEDWKIIGVGQNKTQSTGFFGQPIVGSSAGTGLSGSPGMAPGLGGASPSGGAFGNSGFGNSGFGNSGSAPGGSGSSLFSPSGTSSPTSGSTADPSASGSSTPTTDANGNPIPPGSSTGSSASATGTGIGSGPTLGGLGLMGVSPTNPKQSILVWHKKNHYVDWEFFYDPQADLTTLSSSTGAAGQPAGSTPVGSGPTSNNPGFGNSSSPTFGGSSSSFGSGSTTTPSSGSSQPSPQQ
jgi:type II secretory pathway pseudopilin PulG